MSIQEYAEKIKAFLGSNRVGDGIVILALFLTAFGSFVLGRLSVLPASGGSPQFQSDDRIGIASAGFASQEGGAVSVSSSRIAASRNGAKYYMPWCSGQDRISEENKIWFSTEDEAQAAGYERSATCKDM